MRARLQSVALVGLGVAIGGFVAVPASHLIGHEDDHVHVGGTIVYVDPDDPEAARRAQSAAERRGGASDPGAPEPSDGHGSGSLAHFGAAVTASVATPAPAPPRVREPDAAAAPRSAEPRPPERSGRRARAPPAR